MIGASLGALISSMIAVAEVNYEDMLIWSPVIVKGRPQRTVVSSSHIVSWIDLWFGLTL